jgi:hypothetical protein
MNRITYFRAWKVVNSCITQTTAMNMMKPESYNISSMLESKVLNEVGVIFVHTNAKPAQKPLHNHTRDGNTLANYHA